MLQNSLYRQTILDTLQTAIQDTSPLVRAKAAEALGKLGDETTIPILLACLNDETPLVRSSIARSLGELGSELVISPLLQLLQDTEERVRESAIEALGNLALGGTMQIILDLPDFLATNDSFNQADWMREIAIALFHQERISLGSASEIAGMHLIDFQQLLARRGICIHYDVEDFEQELQGLQERGWL